MHKLYSTINVFIVKKRNIKSAFIPQRNLARRHCFVYLPVIVYDIDVMVIEVRRMLVIAY